MKITIQKDIQKPEKTPQEWVPHPDGGKYLIASIDRPSFQYAQNINIAEDRKVVDSGDITDEFAIESDARWVGMIGRYLILGWDDTGIGLDWSPENAEAVCKYAATEEKPKYGNELALWVLEKSRTVQENAAKAKAEIVGKQSNTTSGALKSQD